MSFPLAGKTAIVTGGAGGIGFAVAQRFAREGASVVLVGRTQKRLEEAFAKLEASVPTTGITPPPKHKFYRLSIEQPKEWEKLAGKYVSRVFSHSCGLPFIYVSFYILFLTPLMDSFSPYYLLTFIVHTQHPIR